MDHLYAAPIFVDEFRKMKISNFVVASPDVGGIKIARSYAKRMDVDLVVIDKRRTNPNEAEVMNVIGSVENKNVLIVDDLIDTAGTFVNAAEALQKRGAKEIYGACTHPILSGAAFEKLEQSVVKKLFVTDTLPLKHESKKVEVRSVARLFAEAIVRTHRNESISSLFDIDKG
jgi:ribose-phosphate pyrophosphokinase